MNINIDKVVGSLLFLLGIAFFLFSLTQVPEGAWIVILGGTGTVIAFIGFLMIIEGYKYDES